METSLDADESESTIKRIWLRLGEMCRKPSPSRGPAFDCSFLQELIWMTFKKKWFRMVTTSLQLISFMDIFRFWENQHLKCLKKILVPCYIIHLVPEYCLLMENVRILEEVVTFQTCCTAGNRTRVANCKLTKFYL